VQGTALIDSAFGSVRKYWDESSGNDKIRKQIEALHCAGSHQRGLQAGILMKSCKSVPNLLASKWLVKDFQFICFTCSSPWPQRGPCRHDEPPTRNCYNNRNVAKWRGSVAAAAFVSSSLSCVSSVGSLASCSHICILQPVLREFCGFFSFLLPHLYPPACPA
jgi:hypothetical protein